MKIILPQQSLNLLRGLLAQPGWAKTTREIYLGGRLLVETLPEPDTSWILAPEAVAALPAGERATYRETDKAWCAVPIEIEISDIDRDLCRKVLEKTVEQGALGASKWGFLLFREFGFKPE